MKLFGPVSFFVYRLLNTGYRKNVVLTQSLHGCRQSVYNIMRAYTMSELPARLRQLRLLIGYSQEVRATEWQMSQAAMSKLEAGKSIITVERVQQATTFYWLTIDELTTDDQRTLGIKTLTMREQ